MTDKKAFATVSTRRNVYVALFTQWLAAIFSIMATVLISRLMSPRDIGVFAVTMGFSAILAVLQNAGAHEYILYRKEDEMGLPVRRTAYGLSLLTSIFVAGLLVVLAPAVSSFYAEPGMKTVMLILALQTIIGPIASPITSMLAREQNFRLIGIISLISNITLSVTQITLAWFGFGAEGLAWAMVASNLVYLLLNIAWAKEYFILLPSMKGMRQFYKFGLKLLGSNLMVQVNNNAPQILIGHLAGLPASAMYTRANATTQIYSQTVARALDPIINARIAFEGRTSTSSNALVLTSQALLAVSAPFFGFIAIFSPWFVPFMFGSQWGAAIVPTAILCVGFILWPLSTPVSAVLLSAGRPGLLLRIRTINTAFRIGAVLIFASYSLNAACASISLGLYFYFVHGLLAMRKVAGISLRGYFASLTKSVIVSTVTLSCAAAFAIVVGHLDAFQLRLSLQNAPVGFELVMLGGGGLVAALSWFASLVLTRHFIWQEISNLLANRAPPFLKRHLKKT